jgi:hypothetical protein
MVFSCYGGIALGNVHNWKDKFKGYNLQPKARVLNFLKMILIKTKKPDLLSGFSYITIKLKSGDEGSRTPDLVTASHAL